MHGSSLLSCCPVAIAELPANLRLRIISAAGAGFPSPAQDWQETAINLVELLRLDRAASFVFRVSGHSIIDAGLYDHDVVVVDRDAKPVNGRIVIAIVDGGFVVRQLCIKAGVPMLERATARSTMPRRSPTRMSRFGASCAPASATCKAERIYTMPTPIYRYAEFQAEAADLIADFPDVPVNELASGLERRADGYDNGHRRALPIAAELRRQAAAAAL